MPGRPVQHVLADRSEARFKELLLPSIFRPNDKDYGVDGQVEVVTDGHATGLTFSVQLKATSQALPAALRVRLSQSNWDYLRRRPEPVLLALYVEAADTFYTQWIQRVDLHYGSSTARGIGFRIPPDCSWSEVGHAELLRDVRAWRAVQDGARSPPILLRVVTPSATPPRECRLLRSVMDSVARRAAGVVALAETEDAMGTVTAEGKNAVISLGLRGSVTLHRLLDLDLDNRRQAVADMGVAIGVAFQIAGQSALACPMFRELGPDSEKICDPRIVAHVADAFLSTTDPVGSLRLATVLQARDGGWLPHALLTGVALEQLRAVSKSERQRALGELRRAAAHVEADPDAPVESRAAARYTLANALRCTGNPREAIAEYGRARRHSVRYLKRPHFRREVGGSLFEIGRYRWAERWHAEALNLGDDYPATVDLRADCMLFAGEYAAAQEAFRAAPRSAALPSPPLFLKAWFLDRMIRATGIHQQQRRQAHQPVRQPRSDADYVDEAMNDLRVDALDARAWFNLGVARSRAGENEPALHAFVGAALFGKCDVEAWRNAFMLAFQIDGAGVLLLNIVLAAHDEAEAAFIDAVCDSAAAQAGEEAAAAVETAIREILRYDPREPEQVQLRMIEPADTDG